MAGLAGNSFAITPDDNAYLEKQAFWIMPGSDGLIKYLPTAPDAVPVTVAVSAYVRVPVMAVQVFATGTTATDLVGLF